MARKPSVPDDNPIEEPQEEIPPTPQEVLDLLAQVAISPNTQPIMVAYAAAERQESLSRAKLDLDSLLQEVFIHTVNDSDELEKLAYALVMVSSAVAASAVAYAYAKRRVADLKHTG